jgi:hypothetical protein
MKITFSGKERGTLFFVILLSSSFSFFSQHKKGDFFLISFNLKSSPEF